MRYSKRHIIGILVLLAIIAALIALFGTPKPLKKPELGELPKELVQACADKEDGDVCTVRGFNGTEESRCEYLDDTLVCFPHRMPPEGKPPGR
jgi:hypothetical protein